MRKLDSLLVIGSLVVSFAPFFWEDFPSMAALYALMTAMSAMYGLSCLLRPKEALLWQQQNIPADVQRVWSQRMGVLYLLNAALCPLGWLLAIFVAFDTDFILFTQIIGFLLVSLLSFVPLLRLWPKKR